MRCLNFIPKLRDEACDTTQLDSFWTKYGKREPADRENDEQSFWGDLYAPDLSQRPTLGSLACIPCLVLLGELGTGKSNEMKKVFDSLDLTGSSDVKLHYPDGQIDYFREIFSHEIFNQ